MIGAIAGDIIGSRFERGQAPSYDFELFHPSCRFTDDTVCTLAVARAIMDQGDFADHIRNLAREFPNSGYGGMFRKWFRVENAPAYGSWGNGAPMRVSSVGWLARSLDQVDELAAAQASVSHDHPEPLMPQRQSQEPFSCFPTEKAEVMSAPQSKMILDMT
jgi:ADP-ribosyl-[dinitrogen reductase] hydrolase